MAGDIDRVILVRLSGKRMAIDLAAVAEVSEFPETWKIPLAPVFFTGVMNSHGYPIPVLDLAKWMGTGAGRQEGKILILVRTFAHLALWVDDVERMVSMSGLKLLHKGEGVIASVHEIDGTDVPLISVESLINMLEAEFQGTMSRGTV